MCSRVLLPTTAPPTDPEILEALCQTGRTINLRSLGLAGIVPGRTNRQTTWGHTPFLFHSSNLVCKAPYAANFYALQIPIGEEPKGEAIEGGGFEWFGMDKGKIVGRDGERLLPSAHSILLSKPTV